MTADNDVDSLFEKYSIIQIEDHLIKTRNEIERKKEELRVMVGERYRDLIEAADTIAEMQRSAEAICKNIQTMEGLCESLQQRGLIGFKTKVGPSSTHPFSDINKLSENSYQYSIVVQVKLLVDVPEILWGLTERKEFLAAAELLLLSQHAHTALQLSPNAIEILQSFPVISRQWANIAHFKSNIVRGCSNFIRNEINNYQSVLESVAAVMLIEGCSMLQALSKVLELRKNSLDAVLLMKPTEITKDQLTQFVLLLISSLKIVNFIFSGDKNTCCNLEEKIKDVSGINESGNSNSRPILLLNESSLTLSFLPKSVEEFRPKLRSSYLTLEGKILEEEVNLWLMALVNQSSTSIKQLLSYTTSIKTLSLIRNSIWDMQDLNTKDDLWDKVLNQLLHKASFCPWHSTIRNLVLERAQGLIKRELNETKKSLFKMVGDLAIELKNNPRTCYEEGDITEFVWSESSSDLPDQIVWTNTVVRNSKNSLDNTGLFYKTRGYTKKIQNICKAVSIKLNHLLEDLLYYAPSSLTEATQKGFSSDISEVEDTLIVDYNKLLLFLQNETIMTFTQSLSEFDLLANEYSEKINNSCDLHWDDQAQIRKAGPNSTVIVVISRLCHALSFICPHLKICAGASLLGNVDTARRVLLGVQPDIQSWIDLRDRFISMSVSMMTKFLTIVTQTLTKALKENFVEFTQESNAEDLLFILSSWEAVPIEEEGEGGQVIHSSILVPVHPSPALTEVLTRICSSINCICAHTISRISQLELVNQLCLQLISIYEDIEPFLQNVNQTMALQLIFDLKLIQSMLLTRDNKDCGVRIASLIHKFETKVDPFDLNVFHPHLSSRVKVAACRLQVLLGIILPKEKQLVNNRGAQSMSSSSANNSLPVVPSVEIPRFSNVPLPISSSNRNKSLTVVESLSDVMLSNGLQNISFNKTHIEQTSSQSFASATSDSTLSASRSAAALLSSWFGGSS